MNMNQALSDLKEALINLNPTGEHGFEGFLAVVLGKITGHDFRLAGAGSQHGKDGEAVSPTSHITFEGKLYTVEIPKNEVLSKATEIIGGAQVPDAWILGATVAVKPQISEPLQNAFERSAISLIVLDWPETVAIPPLACACAIAENESIEFLGRHVLDTEKVRKARVALKAIQAHENFETAAQILQRDLQEPTLGAPIATKRNREWLGEAFSDRKRSKQVFGQALAPMAATHVPTLDRTQLLAALENSAFGEPHSRIVALIGGEGCGKSWLFAKSWARHGERPLTVVIPASDLKEVAAYGQIEPNLIDRLIEQSGDSVTDFKRKRWQRRFDQWKTCNAHSAAKLVVFVDGLNQNPDFEWGRWLDGASTVLEKLGGVLIISARESFFRDRLKGFICSDIEAIQVPEWTRSELSQVLSGKGINIGDVNPLVVKTLQNPRILSIAVELLDNTQIESFSELSVERLLFEHIRVGAKDNSSSENPDQFIKRLSQHAEEIINRVKEQKHEDRLVFGSGTSLNPKTYNLSTDLLAVMQGRFYHSLPEDPTLYSLTDDGLAVAFGLSIIKALQKAERNNNDLHETLDTLLEPIAALDKTSQAVFSALLLASVDEKCTKIIQQALIEAFLRLQNINNEHYPAFSSVARTATEASMRALFALSVLRRRVANKDWLLAALRGQRRHAASWNIISQQIDRWLRLYSLAPEIGVFSSHTGEEKAKVEKETEERRQRIDDRLGSLPPAEKAFLDEQMIRNDGVDPSDIASEMFTLLAGMPLFEFSEALVAWCYSQSLNSSYRTPHDEFQFLVQQNRCDWAKTRENLLEKSVVLRANDASCTAKWAMFSILRATSTLDDAESATALYEILTAEREKYPGWRLVERYCPNDPCDPTSSKPEEIEATADRYRKVDLSASSKSRWMGDSDHFLRDALPGLARFAGDVAAEVNRACVKNIAERDSREELRLGLFRIEAHAALLSPEIVAAFLQKANSLSAPYDQTSNKLRDEWIISQYSLLVALPHLDGDGQLKSLMSLPHPGPTLLKLTQVLKPASAESLDRALDHVWQSGDEYKQATALIFARYSGTTISPHSRELIARFCTSASSMVRSQAFNIISYLKDRSLLEGVAQGFWRADALDPKEQYFEVWYGSEVLIQAGVEGIIGPEEILTRISPKLFGVAAAALGQSAQPLIANCLNASIERALGLEVAHRPPAVEQNNNPERFGEPPLLSLMEADEELRPEDFFKRLSENPEEFDARQKRGWEAFDRFEQTLTREKAQLIIEDVGTRAIEALLSAAPERATKLANAILELPDYKLRNIQHVALKLARLLSRDQPVVAKRLFEHLKGHRAFVTFTYGLGEIPLEAISIWRSSDNPEMAALRGQRLDCAANDEELATEVLAALTSSKSAFLEQYARGLLDREEPAAAARAIMIFGFGEESRYAEDVLDQYADAKGLIGAAVNAARFAYDRNRWSRHWFEQMCNAESGDDFWRYSVLFLKIVDARFELWEGQIERAGAPSRNFEPSIERELQNRIKSWAKKREKTLFGAKAPRSVFIITQ